MVPTEPARDADAILRFWFEDCRPWQWFRQNQRFDQLIGKRFGALCLSAQAGGLSDWEQGASSALALVLLLDQFSRHVWRGESQAFAGDARAVSLSREALRQGWIQSEPECARRQFWLMPLLHSEEIATVESAIPLLEEWADHATARIAQRNLQVLLREGRYPWRNQ
ncbi:tetratricopeptide-like helical domain-conataining protein [Synechococcus sp. MEDNS5]|uniref:DUF924 family protein n=1 Tax=Synechococcus sp. MEDNS5 TaxID=1442554 RepID=UPI00164973C8|nr:DUF924 family protein [Synechococcus sp. MEDNS5]QNJ05729.1 tetratricopeptide-like helical domain-conataining protein [Synechococcus sp. MEDNS5]